ncbi:hypothetical protein P154DRAFT_426303 [Amniculicola lignicola CBS 123094]|uniref:Uncharacterized protein n=1 Tax=Amniculicola lignicola CBS 123094 TaxID=1392246 RepID=A0A6A5WT31_9PLEO|nr:hypothetical protein P154DRAFT_426303 [Amniculicola lignicola CBS 123094]
MIPSSQRLIRYVGSITLDHFPNPALRQVVKDFCEKQENENPNVKRAEIKGTHFHQSHDDPNDPKPVISIRFKDENDRRIGTGHIHEDGTGQVKWK